MYVWGADFLAEEDLGRLQLSSLHAMLAAVESGS